MVNRALLNFDKPTLDLIHNHSLEILKGSGIRFPSDKAIRVFKDRGFRTDSQTVYFKEKDIVDALGTVPTKFTIKARNPNKSICIGGGDYMMAPGYGPPFIIETTGEKRDATLNDVQVLQTRPNLKTTFISGYPDETIAKHGVVEAGVVFLQKPFTSTELAQKIRTVLDTPISVQQ